MVDVWEHKDEQDKKGAFPRDVYGRRATQTKPKKMILRWFDQVKRRHIMAPVRTVETLTMEGMMSKCRPKLTLDLLLHIFVCVLS